MIFPTPRQQTNRTQQLDHMLFGRNHPRLQQRQSPQQSLLRPDTMSSLTTKGADGLSKTLGNVQQVLKAIETTAPVVQQYAPMIKNLPALYRIMKAVNDVEDEPESDDKGSETQIPLQQEEANNHTKDVELKKDLTKEKRRRTGESKPILFI